MEAEDQLDILMDMMLMNLIWKIILDIVTKMTITITIMAMDTNITDMATNIMVMAINITDMATNIMVMAINITDMATHIMGIIIMDMVIVVIAMMTLSLMDLVLI